MNAIVLGKHARLPSFRTLKPLGNWELKNATNYIHYVILTMYICIFFMFFPNKPDEDWYWPVQTRKHKCRKLTKAADSPLPEAPIDKCTT